MDCICDSVSQKNDKIFLTIVPRSSFVAHRCQGCDQMCRMVSYYRSTPVKMASHSFHPVPTLFVSDLARTDAAERYGERDAVLGGLGQFEAMYMMLLAMPHAGKLGKFGA